MSGYVVNVDCNNYDRFVRKVNRLKCNSSQILHAIALTYVTDHVDFNKISVGKTREVFVSPIICNCAQLLYVCPDDFFNRLVFDYVVENSDILSNVNYDYFLQIFYRSLVVYD